ncbi:hypothetical protein TrCOL_g10811 [Triparma columacea]|uniref:Uncharacterized protein n=1 Tax=Triparma columacea TaxID=722753 RepID=A0A9W7LF70_9STRA|nr:hypothetical protein TrCOL_g10811 [Triparma columacea]
MNDQGHLVTRVYGLDVNPERAGLVRKVLSISSAMAFLEFANFIYSSTVNDVDMAWSIWPLIFGLMIPACGYFGAKNSSRELISWFIGCSGCVAIAVIISLSRLYDVYSDASDSDRDSMSHSIVVASVLSIPTLILAIAGVCYGSELQSKREHIIVRSNQQQRQQAVPQVTINVQQQPGVYGHQMPQPAYPPQSPYGGYPPPQGGYPANYPPPQAYVQQPMQPQQAYAQQQYVQASAPPPVVAYAQPVDKSSYT